MDFRRDLLPPLLALGFSLGLHGALFGVRPLWWTQPSPEPVDTVVVQFLDEAGPAAPVAPQPEPELKPQPPAAATPPVRQRPPPVPTAPSPPPPPPAEVLTEPVPPVVEVAPAEAPPAPPPPAAPAAPASSMKPEVAVEPSPALEVVPPPSMSDLLPRASDLQRFAGRPELPDPTAAGVREATLGLGTEDLRYRGYLETVHAAIDRSEKWKEAVLMGGGGGVVVVRMTVTSLGQLVSTSVTRSSGSHLLDSAALDAVQRAHIPPFPSHWQLEKLHLHAQFNYELVTY